MGQVIFVVLLISLLVMWDFRVRIRLLVSHAVARRYSEEKVFYMAKSVFAVSSCYLGHRIRFSSSVPIHQLPKNFLLISNHQSLVDIPTLVYCFRGSRLRFVAKKRYFRFVPLISIMLRLQRHAVIGAERTVRGRGLGIGGTMFYRNSSPVVFPEGTRSRNGQLGRFHLGACRRILTGRSLPVVVVAIDGGWRSAEARQMSSGLRDCTYLVRIVGCFPPPQSREAVDSVVAAAHGAIAGQLAMWRSCSSKAGSNG